LPITSATFVWASADVEKHKTPIATTAAAKIPYSRCPRADRIANEILRQKPASESLSLQAFLAPGKQQAETRFIDN
jgi:hypothetical protein